MADSAVDPMAEVEAIKCEANHLFPCLRRSPNTAKYMVRYALCDCDQAAEDAIVSHTMCETCLRYVLSQPETGCASCDTRYIPGKDILAEIVRFK